MYNQTIIFGWFKVNESFGINKQTICSSTMWTYRTFSCTQFAIFNKLIFVWGIIFVENCEFCEVVDAEKEMFLTIVHCQMEKVKDGPLY